MLKSRCDYYNEYGGGYYQTFIDRNPEFDTQGFLGFVEKNNRGDRDVGEVMDIAKHEILRLAAEYEEERWRFPDYYGYGKASR